MERDEFCLRITRRGFALGAKVPARDGVAIQWSARSDEHYYYITVRCTHRDTQHVTMSMVLYNNDSWVVPTTGATSGETPTGFEYCMRASTNVFDGKKDFTAIATFCMSDRPTDDRPASERSASDRPVIAQQCGVCRDEKTDMVALAPCGHTVCSECRVLLRTPFCPFCCARFR